MLLQMIERETPENTSFLEDNQKAAPSVLIVTNGASYSIENAFHIARKTGLRLVIALYPEVAGQSQVAISGQKATACQVTPDELSQAAHLQGIQEVVAYQQDCWGEDEFDDLVNLENSQYTIVAF